MKQNVLLSNYIVKDLVEVKWIKLNSTSIDDQCGKTISVYVFMPNSNIEGAS
jgi:hypothetical protein